MATKTKDDALKAEVLRLLYIEHNLSALVGDRKTEKAKKLEGFVDRAFERGLTAKHVEENLALGRPPHWIETGG